MSPMATPVPMRNAVAADADQAGDPGRIGVRQEGLDQLEARQQWQDRGNHPERGRCVCTAREQPTDGPDDDRGSQGGCDRLDHDAEVREADEHDPRRGTQ